jgi:hypothetical protein
MKQARRRRQSTDDGNLTDAVQENDGTGQMQNILGPGFSSRRVPRKSRDSGLMKEGPQSPSRVRVLVLDAVPENRPCPIPSALPRPSPSRILVDKRFQAIRRIKTTKLSWYSNPPEQSSQNWSRVPLVYAASGEINLNRDGLGLDRVYPMEHGLPRSQHVFSTSLSFSLGLAARSSLTLSPPK